MFGWTFIRTSELEGICEGAKELSEENVALRASLDSLNNSFSHRVSSGMRNYDAVVSLCETDEAKFSLYRKVTSSANDNPKLLHQFRIFLNSLIKFHTPSGQKKMSSTSKKKSGKVKDSQESEKN